MTVNRQAQIVAWVLPVNVWAGEPSVSPKKEAHSAGVGSSGGGEGPSHKAWYWKVGEPEPSEGDAGSGRVRKDSRINCTSPMTGPLGKGVGNFVARVTNMGPRVPHGNFVWMAKCLKEVHSAATLGDKGSSQVPPCVPVAIPMADVQSETISR